MKNGINNSSKNYDSNCGPYDMNGRTLVNHINYDGFWLRALEILMEKLHTSTLINQLWSKINYMQVIRN